MPALGAASEDGQGAPPEADADAAGAAAAGALPGGAAAAAAEGAGRLQVAPQMVTMSLLPRAQWQALMYLDTIRERGRPTEPPKKPEAAPFFLPTLASLAPNPVFAPPEAAAVSAQGDEPASRVRRGHAAAGEQGPSSALLRLIAQGQAAGDYSAAAAYLRATGPSALDGELCALALSSPDPAQLRPEDEAALASVLAFLQAEAASSRSFELVQAFLAVFLRLHGESVAACPALQRAAACVRDALKASWGRLDGLFQETRCTLGFLSGLGQQGK